MGNSSGKFSEWFTQSRMIDLGFIGQIMYTWLRGDGHGNVKGA